MTTSIVSSISEKKGLVKVRVSGCALDAINEIKKAHLPGEQTNELTNKERYMLRDSYTAAAKCHESDTFDAKKGKMVAEDKAMRKYSLAKAKAIRRYANDMAYMAKFANEVAVRYEKRIEKIMDT